IPRLTSPRDGTPPFGPSGLTLLRDGTPPSGAAHLRAVGAVLAALASSVAGCAAVEGRDARVFGRCAVRRGDAAGVLFRNDRCVFAGVLLARVLLAGVLLFHARVVLGPVAVAAARGGRRGDGGAEREGRRASEASRRSGAFGRMNHAPAAERARFIAGFDVAPASGARNESIAHALERTAGPNRRQPQ